MRLHKHPTQILLTLLLFSFQLTANSEESTEQPLNPCLSNKKNMCTQEYAPVCGIRGILKSSTYSNACYACSDPDVEAYVYGECASHQTEAVNH